MTVWQNAFRARVGALLDQIREWIRRARDRGELRKYIRDGMLERQDFGIVLGDAQAEASKPFWQR
jgi:uncharacterized protein YjiS (DUF1127 family)